MNWEYRILYVVRLPERPEIAGVNGDEYKSSLVSVETETKGKSVKISSGNLSVYLAKAGQEGWETSGGIAVMGDIHEGCLILKRPLEEDPEI